MASRSRDGLALGTVEAIWRGCRGHRLDFGGAVRAERYSHGLCRINNGAEDDATSWGRGEGELEALVVRGAYSY
jgi:hypothetical protein